MKPETPAPKPSWASIAMEIKKEKAQRPPGCHTLEEIASQLGTSEERAKEIVKEAIKRGKARTVQHKKLNEAGALIPCVYYERI
jgi:predicted transcriptional regulator